MRLLRTRFTSTILIKSHSELNICCLNIQLFCAHSVFLTVRDWGADGGGLDLSGFINPCSRFVFSSWLMMMMMGQVEKLQTEKSKMTGNGSNTCVLTTPSPMNMSTVSELQLINWSDFSLLEWNFLIRLDLRPAKAVGLGIATPHL